MASFDRAACEQCRESLGGLDWFRPFDPAAVPDALNHYLRHYTFDTTLDSIPCTFHWGYVQAPPVFADTRVAVYSWRRTFQGSGTVLLVHGLFDHVGLYQPFIRYCLAAGFDVLAVDLPGHGLSDGEPTVVDGFDQYTEVIRTLVRHWKTSDPARAELLFGVGQSTGAAVLMNDVFTSGGAHPYQRLALLGPLVQPTQWWIGSLVHRLVGGMLQDIPRNFSIPNSHDEQFHAFLRDQDPLQARRLSLRWINSMSTWVRDFPRQPVSQTPLLIVQGTADRVVNWQVNVPMIQAHFPQHTLALIEGARHHLVNEADPWRSAIYDSVGKFLLKPGP